VLGELVSVWTEVSPAAVAWLLSFSIHSTLLLGLIWLISKGVRSHRLKDVLWKTALLGAILTTTLQYIWDGQPLGGQFQLLPSPISSYHLDGREMSVAPTIPQSSGVSEQSVGDASGPRLSRGEILAEPSSRRPAIPKLEPDEQASADMMVPLRGYLASALWDSARWLFALWLLGAVVMGLRFIVARHRLYASLDHRYDMEDGPLTAVWARLCRSVGVRHSVRLTCSPFISSPMVLSRKEVCLPAQVVDKLSLEKQKTLLAHELTHIARGDPAWLVLSGILQSLFFFQPLYCLARRNIQECAEYLCDDHAVRCVGRGVTLARCLVEVVGWPDLHGKPTAVATVSRSVGTTKGISNLEYRVRRLLDGSWTTRAEVPRWWWAIIVLSVLVVVWGVGPGVAVGVRLDEVAPVAAAVGVKPTGPWQVVLRREVGRSTIMAGFLDEDSGITVGEYGEVYYTTDGGDAWFGASSGSSHVLALDIVDDKVAWQCGHRAVRVSIDGGRTWEIVQDYGSAHNPCRYLSFLDAKTGWIATADKLKATTDGGASWTGVALPKGVWRIAGIALRTPTSGYLLDTNGVLHITHNGGRSWFSRSLGLDEEPSNVLLYPSGAAIRFFDSSHGMVVLGLVGGEEGKIAAMHTSDGGRTWRSEDVPAEFGVPYLTRDGLFLTVVRFRAAIGSYDDVRDDITVFRYHQAP
jgi:photosystem II stability/assembly factor-like uncharacterized protein